jgi:hypothetical protein
MMVRVIIVRILVVFQTKGSNQLLNLNNRLLICKPRLLHVNYFSGFIGFSLRRLQTDSNRISLKRPSNAQKIALALLSLRAVEKKLNYNYLASDNATQSLSKGHRPLRRTLQL